MTPSGEVAPTQPRAIGRALVGVHGAGSKLRDLHQSGSLKVLLPRTDHSKQAVLINTAGGITGGDEYTQSIRVSKQARLSVTTQAAERAYRAQPNQIGKLSTDLQVSDGARLSWLPQETILFDGCALRRRLKVKLSDDARFTLCEPLVFGRAAMDETLTNAYFDDQIYIVRNGQKLFCDKTLLSGHVTDQLQRPAIANGAGAMALVIHIAPDASIQCDRIRETLPKTAGATVIGEDMLVARILAKDSFEMRKTLMPFLTDLIDEPLPRPWMI